MTGIKEIKETQAGFRKQNPKYRVLYSNGKIVYERMNARDRNDLIQKHGLSKVTAKKVWVKV